MRGEWYEEVAVLERWGGYRAGHGFRHVEPELGQQTLNIQALRMNKGSLTIHLDQDEFAEALVHWAAERPRDERRTTLLTGTKAEERQQKERKRRFSHRVFGVEGE